MTLLGGAASSRVLPSVLKEANLRVVGKRAVVCDRDVLLESFASYASRLFPPGVYSGLPVRVL